MKILRIRIPWSGRFTPSLPWTEKETSPVVYDYSSQWLVVSKDFANPEAVAKICNYMHFMGLGPPGNRSGRVSGAGHIL